MKTIKELSEELKISTVSVYRWLKKPELQTHVLKRGNTMVVDERGVAILKARCQADIDVEQHEQEVEQQTSVLEASDDYIALLRAQLREKDAQINCLLSLVDNAQKLQATHLIADRSRVVPRASGKKTWLQWLVGCFL